MKHHRLERKYVVCAKNEGYEVSLERWKIYRILSDKEIAEKGLVRIVDESGQSYVYPQDYFVPIRLPQLFLKAFKRAA
ncbi:MAG: hypothetical protein HYS08_08700 [Chlamydiae bacterium]|nr:hypothetical protein [Chlamydiota bacterium]